MKVSDYGDMLAKVKGKELLVTCFFGSYQGDWIGVLKDGDKLELWKGSYGSCSGCDFLEAVRDWKTEEVDDKEAQDYFKGETPFLILDKADIDNMTLDEFKTVFPKNIQDEIYYFDIEELFKALRK